MRIDHPVDHAEQRRFATTRRADEDRRRTRRNREAEALDRAGTTGKLLADGLEFAHQKPVSATSGLPQSSLWWLPAQRIAAPNAVGGCPFGFGRNRGITSS